MTQEEFMEMVGTVELSFNAYMQKGIKETMEFFEDKQVAKAGIFQALLVEIMLMVKRDGVSISQIHEMIDSAYNDDELAHITAEDFQ